MFFNSTSHDQNKVFLCWSLIIWSAGLLWCCGLPQLCYQDDHKVPWFCLLLMEFLHIWLKLIFSFNNARMSGTRNVGVVEVRPSVKVSFHLLNLWVNSHHICKMHCIPLTPNIHRPAKRWESAAWGWKVPERGMEGGGRWRAGVNQKCRGGDQGKSCKEGGSKEGVAGQWSEWLIACQKSQPNGGGILQI